MAHALWQAGYVALTDEHGVRLPSWRVEALVRDDAEPDDVLVRATARGTDWVHG